MQLADLDPIILRTEARRCRRLADILPKAEDIALLGRLAVEFERLAGEAERARSAQLPA